MRRPSLAARLVEVIADRGRASPRYRYGSGCIVRGRTVLTTAHVLAGAKTVRIRDPNKVVYRAAIDREFLGDADGPGPDLALLEIEDPGIDMPPMDLAVVDRETPSGDPVERCHVLGYPTFMERMLSSGDAIRDTADAYGRVSTLSHLVGGLLSVQVSSAPRQLPRKRLSEERHPDGLFAGLGDSQWSGMSGGPLVADGCLLGVVTEHAPREGPSTITVVPLTALDADAAHPGWGPGVANPGAWWERLGVTGAEELRRLPARKQTAEPAYLATVREIHRRTRMLTGRQKDLTDISSFAVGAAGYRWLVGGSWAGKTSLLAEAVSAALPEQVSVVAYFLSRREADADSARFLAAVVPQLSQLLDEDPPTADLHQFRSLWERAAEWAAENDRHLLLVVDGLDEDARPPGLPSVAAALPAAAGGHTHVLVSSRPHPDLPGDLPLGHPLARTEPVDLTPFEGAPALAELARQEIDALLHGGDAEFAADVLGLLTAAAGPVAVGDLAGMMAQGTPLPPLRRRIRRILTGGAARSVQPVGPAGHRRYQFAHASLLEHARATEDLSDPDFRNRVHGWARVWRDAGWPVAADDGETGAPRYLLDAYPSTLADEPTRLTELVADCGWVDAAIQSVGVDRVLAHLRVAAAAAPPQGPARDMCAAVIAQAHQLRPPCPISQPGYVPRQLCLEAAERVNDRLATECRARMEYYGVGVMMPLWTTRRVSGAQLGELGHHNDAVRTLVVLADGRAVSGGRDGLVLLWDPARPATGSVHLGRHDGPVAAMGVLPDGRVASGGDDGRVLLWEPAIPGANPVELGRHDRPVAAMAVLPDGRVASGALDALLLWETATPGSDPIELGSRALRVSALAVLPDGRVVCGTDNGGLSLREPARPRADPIGIHVADRGVAALAVLPDGRVVVGGAAVVAWDLAVRPPGCVELGAHDDWVSAVAVLPDGRVASGGDDRRVLVWDPEHPGTSPLELGAHDDWVSAVGVLPDGRVISGGHDGRLLVWDLTRPAPGRTRLGYPDGKLKIRALTALTDGRVISGGEDRRMLLWNPSAPGTGPIEVGRHDSAVSALATVPDGRVATGDTDGRVLLWDLASPGTDPVELGRHGRTVRALAAGVAGRLVSGGDDRRVLIWDLAIPGADPVELGRHDGGVLSVGVLPHGRLVSVGFDGRVLLWDPAQPATDPLEVGRHAPAARTVAVLPDGHVATGGHDGRVLIWDAMPGAPPIELGARGDTVRAVVALPDGRIVSGGDNPRMLLWDTLEHTSDPIALRHHIGVVRALAVLPDGRVVGAGDGRRVVLWDPSERAPGPAALGHHDDIVRAVAVLPDGRIVSGGDDRGVLLWNPDGRATNPILLGRHHWPVRALALLPNGRVVSAGDDQVLRLWDPDGSDPVELGRTERAVLALAVLPGGRVVTAGHEQQVLIWDTVHPGTDPIEFNRHDYWVEAVAVLPDGHLLVATDEGRLLRFDPTLTLPGTAPLEVGQVPDVVHALAVLTDGHVVSGGQTGAVLLWNPNAQGADPVELYRHDAGVHAVAVLPDDRVVSGGRDRRVLVWDIATRTQVAQVGCSVTALATGRAGARRGDLAVAHQGAGISLWSNMATAAR